MKSEREGMATRVAHALHARLLTLLLGTYALAAIWPGPGLAARRLSFGDVLLGATRVHLTLPFLVLSLLLMNAGLGVPLDRLKELARRPWVLIAGLAANLLVPVLFLLAATLTMHAWHNPDEVQTILFGLALVAAMPIAGSSTAWSQNADGDLTLSLGLVLGSTLISPFTTPLALLAAGLLARGDYATELSALAAGGAGAFLWFGVIAPTALGLGIRRIAGGRRVARVTPGLKLANMAALLFLNYANAAVSLPQAIASPDVDFLVVTFTIVVSLCVVAFTTGWAVARLFGVESSSRASLMFGLGMNNNGTGLVMASIAMTHHPRVLLPIIFYNLTQHVLAGALDRMIGRASLSPRHGAGEPEVVAPPIPRGRPHARRAANHSIATDRSGRAR